MRAVDQSPTDGRPLRTQPIRGTGGHTDLRVVRRDADGTRRAIQAEEDAVLTPGAVVEVSLLAEFALDGGKDTGASRRSPEVSRVPPGPERVSRTSRDPT